MFAIAHKLLNSCHCQ